MAKKIVTDDQVAHKYIKLKQSAASRNIKFSLSLRKVRRLLSQTKCYYTEIDFINMKDHEMSMTIDRVDNSVGYTDDNTVACIKKFNSMKNDLSVDNIKIMYKKVVQHLNKIEKKNKINTKSKRVIKP